MKVILINNRFGTTAAGGAERVVDAEARALRQAKNEVVIVRAAAAEAGESFEDGLRIINFRAPNIFPFHNLGRHGLLMRALWHLIDLFNWPAAKNLDAIIQHEKPDVIHTHNLKGLGLRLSKRIRRRQIRHVHTAHDVQLIEPSGQLDIGQERKKLRLGQRLHALLVRQAMGSPGAVIFPSQFLFEWYDRFGFFRTSKTYVVPNPVPALGAAREEPTVPPVFLYVGQLEPHKGILELVAAWEEWGGRGLLEIGGDGSLYDRLMQMVANHPTIKLLGRLSGEALLQAYRRASFVVLPSQVVENSPTVIGEAFSQGTPVLARDTGGVAELVGDWKTGFLFSTEKIAISAALEQAGKIGAEDWLKLSRRCQETAAKMTADKHLEKLLIAYAQTNLMTKR